MHPQDHFFRCDAARLLTIGSRVAIEETRRELFQCGYLLAKLFPGKDPGAAAHQSRGAGGRATRASGRALPSPSIPILCVTRLRSTYWNAVPIIVRSSSWASALGNHRDLSAPRHHHGVRDREPIGLAPAAGHRGRRAPPPASVWGRAMARPTLTWRTSSAATAKPYREVARRTLSTAQQRVMAALESCRTAALGGHVERCDHCGHTRVWHNSCRNRHCPGCQSLARAAWIEARTADLLECPYFHVVFTVPQAIAEIAAQNNAVVYNILFHATADTLRTIAADPRHLGATIGFFAVLHTWGQTLMHHPHLHCVVPGGGLSPDGTRWIACRPGFSPGACPVSSLPSALSRSVAGCLRHRAAPLRRLAPSPRRSGGLRRASPAHPTDRVGRVCETAFRRAPTSPGVRRSLHAPRRHRQSPTPRHGRRPRALPLEELPGRPLGDAEDDDPRGAESSSGAFSCTSCRAASIAFAITAGSAPATARTPSRAAVNSSAPRRRRQSPNPHHPPTIATATRRSPAVQSVFYPPRGEPALSCLKPDGAPPAGQKTLCTRGLSAAAASRNVNGRGLIGSTTCPPPRPQRVRPVSGMSRHALDDVQRIDNDFASARPTISIRNDFDGYRMRPPGQLGRRERHDPE